jgi:hypothetical protein
VPGYFTVDNTMIDRYARQIEPTGVAVYCLLARLADEGGLCFPSLTYICETLGLARATAIKYLGKLETYGLVEMNNRETGTGKIQTNAYRLLAVAPARTSSDFEPVTSSPNEPVQNLTAGRHETSSNPEPALTSSNSRPVQNLTGSSSNSELDSTSEDSTSVRDNPNGLSPKNSEPSKQAVEVSPLSDHQRLMAAYRDTLGYPIPNGGQEGRAAKHLLGQGYTPEQVIACYQTLKAEAFWQGKHLSLQTVHKQIGAWLRDTGPVYPAEARNGQHKLTPAEKHARLMKAMGIGVTDAE